MNGSTAQARYARKKSVEAAEVGPLPAVVNPERRESCRLDLALFLKTYMPGHFYREWAADQLTALATLQKNALDGGVSSNASPRGSGKTTIVRGSCLWMALYKHRNFIMAIGPTKMDSSRWLRDFKTELESNDLLYEDFPEVCHPVRSLDGKVQRCAGQTVDGHRTRITWKSDQLVFPSYADNQLGTIVISEGLTGAIRGKNYNDGQRTLRPDFVLLDDVQTRDSARSIMQTDQREAIIQGDVMGLAGHDKAIACAMLCTVIFEGDLSDRYLKRWNGLRSALVIKWPKEKKLWEKYKEVWEAGQGTPEGPAEANKFYSENREQMDAGGVMAYPENYDRETELGPVQHAFNMFNLMGEAGFLAEYQNAPPSGRQVQYDLTADVVMQNLHKLPRYNVPREARIITGFIDINYSGLHYMIAGWENNLTGYVCDCGKWPGGNKVLYDPKNPHGITDEQAIYEGLSQLIPNISGDHYRRDGDVARPDLILVDVGAQWQDSVLGWIRLNGPKMGCRIAGSRGRGIKQYRQTKPIGKPGDHFHLTDFGGKGRVLVHCADVWRMRQQKSWFLPAGSPGGCSMWGKSATAHRYAAEQIAAEQLLDYTPTTHLDVYTWQTQPGATNDLGDCATGVRAAAAFMGCSASPGSATRRKQKPRKRSGVRYTEV